MNDNTFALRFFDDANSVKPDSFSGKELGQLLISFFEGIKELIDIRYPEINASDFSLSLVEIENKSESLLWKHSGQSQVSSALAEIGSAVIERTYTDLPRHTYKSVKHIHLLSTKKKCFAELVEKGKRLFIVAPGSKVITQQKVLAKNDLLIYGILNKIGWDKTRAWVELFDGSKVSFPITDEQLHKLRGRTKEPVALRGKATWNTITKKVVYFKLNEVIDYTPEGIDEGFERIKKIGTGWDSINSDAEIRRYLKE